METKKSCCQEMQNKKSRGILSGVLFGLIPHSFCLAFILFSIIGAAAFTAFFRKFLLVPNFFYFLIFFSFLLATVSSFFYLRKNRCLCVSGIKSSWKYISVLYCSTILVNLLMFFVILPRLANINISKASENNLSKLSINVQIPCPGHAPLIMDEIKKNSDVQNVIFKMPNDFEIDYDSEKTSPEKIIGLDIFKTYQATILN
jgi:hypothetical protein